VIEKSFLPKLLVHSRWIGCSGDRLFQQADPVAQCEIQSTTDEKMDMIGHHHVPAHSDIEGALGSPRKKDECRMNVVASQACNSVMRAKRNVEPTGQWLQQAATLKIIVYVVATMLGHRASVFASTQRGGDSGYLLCQIHPR
jgi:hypothetical protein